MATEKYENLPGVKVTYNDGNLFSNNQKLSANTKSMLIIGSAIDGPVNEPISVRNLGVKETDKLFGGMFSKMRNEQGEIVNTPIKANLVRNMYEAINAGNEDVRLLRVGGTYAKTRLTADNIETQVNDVLGSAKGNESFVVALALGPDQNLTEIVKVEEVDADGGTTLMNIDPDSPQNVIDEIVDNDISFLGDKFSAGNDVKVSFKYMTKSFSSIPRLVNGIDDLTDPAFNMVRDASATTVYRYVSGDATRGKSNWSNDASRHLISVNITNRTTGETTFLNSFLADDGLYLFRVGAPRDGVDPLTDIMSEEDFQTGGIYFTSHYHNLANQGLYEKIIDQNVDIQCSYTYYTPIISQASVTEMITGYDYSFNLRFLPKPEEFSLYYKTSAFDTVKVTLPASAYTIDVANQRVTVKEGAVKVGYLIFAQYTQSRGGNQPSPYIEVLGKFPGSLYGGLKNPQDASSIKGVKISVAAVMDSNGVEIRERIITIIKPDEKKLTHRDNQLVYQTASLPSIKTLRQFANYVNSDPNNNVVTIVVPNEFGDVDVRGLIPEPAKFLGQITPGLIFEENDQYPWLGTDGIFDTTKMSDMMAMYDLLGGTYEIVDDTIVEATQGVYSSLENYIVDQIVLCDVYANTRIDPENTAKNFATQLAQHCATVTAKTWETIGFIGMAPIGSTKLADIQNYVMLVSGKLITIENNKYHQAGIRTDFLNEHYMYDELTYEYQLDEEGQRVDIGSYISVVFGPEVGLMHEKLGAYVTSGVATYAAMVSTLDPEISTTNKQVGVAQGVRYNLSESQHNILVGSRYVTLQQKPGIDQVTRVYVKDGITAALPTSDYTRLSTMRIIHSVVQIIRTKADPYIGLPNGLAQRNALSTEIQSALDQLKELNVIQKFKFTIYSSVQDKVLGNAYITLEVVPQFETRKFYTSVVLRAS